MITRRSFLGTASAVAVLPLRSLAASEDQIEVSLQGVKNLKGLVAAMKEAAGDRAPPKVDLKEVYGALAEAFLDHAHDALERGIEFPSKVRRLLPLRRKVFLPVAVIVPLWGLQFVFELAPFYLAMLASLSIVWGAIVEKAVERRKRRMKAGIESAQGSTV